MSKQENLFSTYGKYKLRKSVFGHFLIKKDIVCAYNALKITTRYFDINLYPYILKTLSSTPDTILKLVPTKFKAAFKKTMVGICKDNILVPKKYNEIDYLEKIKNSIFTGPNLRVLVLHLTDYCNLHCKYCFIEGNISDNYKRENMSIKIFRQGVDLFGNLIKGKKFRKNPSLVFYGGEPLLNWLVLAKGLDYIKAQQKKSIIPKNVEKILITNGTLITNEIAKKLKENNVLVSISIDGPKKFHNLNRVYRNGGGSFHKAIKGLEILRNNGIKPTVSCVLSKETVKNAKIIVKYLLKTLQIKALGINHVSIVPKVNKYDPFYENSYADALLDIQDYIQEFYPKVYERRMNYKINNFLERKIIRADCTGCGEQFSLSPDGVIGICQGYMGNRKTFVNNINQSNLNLNQDPIFIEWSKRSPLNMEKCLKCVGLATCGGGCPRNADFTNGSIWKVDSPFCHFAKKAQKWLIWKNYENIN